MRRDHGISDARDFLAAELVGGGGKGHNGTGPAGHSIPNRRAFSGEKAPLWNLRRNSLMMRRYRRPRPASLDLRPRADAKRLRARPVT